MELLEKIRKEINNLESTLNSNIKDEQKQVYFMDHLPDIKQEIQDLKDFINECRKALTAADNTDNLVVAEALLKDLQNMVNSFKSVLSIDINSKIAKVDNSLNIIEVEAVEATPVQTLEPSFYLVLNDNRNIFETFQNPEEALSYMNQMGEEDPKVAVTLKMYKAEKVCLKTSLSFKRKE